MNPRDTITVDVPLFIRLLEYARELNNILRKINKPITSINSDDILVYLANRDLKDNVSKYGGKNILGIVLLILLLRSLV